MALEDQDYYDIVKILSDHSYFTYQAMLGTRYQTDAEDLLIDESREFSYQDMIKTAQDLNKLHKRIMVYFDLNGPIGSKHYSFYKHLMDEQDLIILLIENNGYVNGLEKFLLNHNSEVYALTEKLVDPLHDLMINTFVVASKELKDIKNPDVEIAIDKSEEFEQDINTIIEKIESKELKTIATRSELEHEILENKLITRIIEKINY